MGFCVLAPAWSQGIVVTPTFALTETLTDNRDLKTERQADLITQVSPGVSMSSRQGALQGSLIYSLNGLLYARESSLNTVYHSLASTARLDLFEGRAGMTASASASRQVVSAYGTQGTDPALNSGNQAQVFSYSLAPYLNGRLLGDVAYQAQLAYSGSRSDAANAGNTATVSGSAGLSGRRGPFGWSLDASRAVTGTGDRPRSHNGRVGGALNYTPDIEVQMSMRAGTEVDDLLTGRSERTTTWGAGLTWVPGPRTSLRADFDRRAFGRSHSLSFSHRMANTIWTASDSRSLQQPGATGRGVVSNYDLFFAQFASLEPDPVRRDAYVRSFLAANGLDGNSAVIVGGFLSTGPTVQRSQNLSAAYQGLRTTVTLTATRTQSSSARSGAAAGDDLANAGSLHQQGLSFSLSHRLTADASIVVTASQQRTVGAGTQAGNDLRSIVATWTARLGNYTNVSLGVRHSSFDSDASPYQESAVIGSIRMQF